MSLVLTLTVSDQTVSDRVGGQAMVRGPPGSDVSSQQPFRTEKPPLTPLHLCGPGMTRLQGEVLAPWLSFL